MNFITLLILIRMFRGGEYGLRKMKYAEMKIEEKRFEVRTNVNEYQRKMLMALGIEDPKKVRIMNENGEGNVGNCDE